MKVQWEAHDIRRNARLRRDRNCRIVGEDGLDGRWAVIVESNGRIMKLGTKAEVAAYLTEHGYIPGHEDEPEIEEIWRS